MSVRHPRTMKISICPEWYAFGQSVTDTHTDIFLFKLAPYQARSSLAGRKQEAGFSNKRLLLLRRVVGPDPFLPAPLEGIDLRESHVHQLLRHTSAGCLRRSGTVKNQGLILRVFLCPG